MICFIGVLQISAFLGRADHIIGETQYEIEMQDPCPQNKRSFSFLSEFSLFPHSSLVLARCFFICSLVFLFLSHRGHSWDKCRPSQAPGVLPHNLMHGACMALPAPRPLTGVEGCSSHWVAKNSFQGGG